MSEPEQVPGLNATEQAAYQAWVHDNLRGIAPRVPSAESNAPHLRDSRTRSRRADRMGQ
jgi:hypothetical protein